MSRSLRPGWIPTMFALAAVLACAMGFTMVAYRFSPLVALAVPVGLVAVTAILARPSLGVCLGLLAVPLEYLNLGVQGAAKLSPAETIFLLTGASAAAHMLLSGRRRTLAAPHLPFGALIAIVATGTLFAEQSFTVAKFVLMWSVFLVLSVWMAGANRRELAALLVATATTGGILGLVAIVHGGNQELVAGGARAVNRAQAGFAQPNTLGAFLVLALPAALVMSVRGPSVLRLPMLGASGLAFAGLMLSLSREAFIGAAVGLAVLLLWRDFRRLFTGLLLLLAVFTAFNLNPLLHSREASVVQQRLATIGSRQETTTNPRIRIWQTTPSIIADHAFLGVGEGNYAVVAPQYGLYDVDGSVIPHAHDILLTVGAETGLIGLAVFIWFVAAVARVALSAAGRRRASDFPYALSLVAALAGLFANGVFDYPIRANVVLALVMLQVGALLAYERLGRADSEAPQRQRREPRAEITSASPSACNLRHDDVVSRAIQRS